MNVPANAGVPVEIGALVEPLAVAWRAVKLSHVKAGDKVLILGAGPVRMSVQGFAQWGSTSDRSVQIGVFVLKVAQ